MEARLKAELVGMETRIRNDMATKADVLGRQDDRGKARHELQLLKIIISACVKYIITKEIEHL